MNLEKFGFNRRPNETFSEYIQRIKTVDIMYKSQDSAIFDLTAFKVKDINAKLKTYDHTYYFSLACSLRDKNFPKAREMNKVPQKTVKLG